MYEAALILAFTIIYLIVINRIFKNKTDWTSIGLLQLGVPWAIHLVAWLLFLNTTDQTWLPLIATAAFITLLFFFIFNYTEMWFRQKYKFDEERVVVINTLNNEPDPDTVNTYKPKIHAGDLLEHIFQHNWTIITRLWGITPFQEMIKVYYEKHPEAVEVINALKQAAEQQPRTKRGAKKDTETSEIPNATFIHEQIRTEALLIFRQIFNGLYFHVRYMRWFFFMTETEQDLHERLKIYIVSLNAILPNPLNLNCAFLIDEIENNKKFTAMFAIEGYRIEEVIERITNFSSDLEIFKVFSKFAQIDRLEKRAEYWEKATYSVLDEFQALSKHNLTIRQRIEDATPKQKKKSLFERLKSNDE